MKILNTLDLPSGTSNPGSGAAGRVFYNTTQHREKIHNGTSWINDGFDLDNGQAGMYAGMTMFGITAFTLTSNTAYFSRFVPTRDIVVTAMAFATTVVDGGSGNPDCDVGLYNSDLTTKIVSAGATASKLNSTGVKSISVSTTLTAGTVYHAAFSVATVNATPAQVMGINFGNNFFAASLFGTGAGIAEGGTKSSSHVLPSSLASPDGTPGRVVLLALKE